MGSCGSVDGAKTPEDDSESLNQSLSSPGCLSGLSSLQSPSTSLASPLNLLASPSTPTAFHEQQFHDAHQNHLNNLKKAAAMTNGGGDMGDNIIIKSEINPDTTSSYLDEKHNNNKSIGKGGLSNVPVDRNTSSINNVPEKHKPPDSTSLFYDKLALIKPPSTSSSSSSSSLSSLSANLRDNPQHPQHPLNINQLTRRDYSSNGSPIFQRKATNTGFPHHFNGPPPPSLSPFSSSPPNPNQYHLHRQFLADTSNHFSNLGSHPALHNLHLQQSLNAHAAMFNAGSSPIQRPVVTSSSAASHRPNDNTTSTDNGAISVT